MSLFFNFVILNVYSVTKIYKKDKYENNKILITLIYEFLHIFYLLNLLI